MNARRVFEENSTHHPFEQPNDALFILACLRDHFFIVVEKGARRQCGSEVKAAMSAWRLNPLYLFLSGGISQTGNESPLELVRAGTAHIAMLLKLIGNIIGVLGFCCLLLERGGTIRTQERSEPCREIGQ